MPVQRSREIADDERVGSGTSTIVPANRLGQLLVEARLREGKDLELLAKQSDFTVGELSDFEAGHRVLNDRLVQRVTTLYELDCGPIIPQRAELTIDLNQNLVSAAGHALPLDSVSHDHVLDRYLSLVYVLRNHQPGTQVPLRDEDVAILAASLAEREELIEEQLLIAMSEDQQTINGLIRWFRQRLWVPGAGALVGVVSIGTLVMTTDEPTTIETADVPEPERKRPLSIAGLALPDITTTTTGTSVATPPTTAATSFSSTTSGAFGAGLTTTSQAVTTTSEATTTTATQARSPQSVGAQAEALLPFDWQTALPGWTIVYRGPSSEFRGLTYPYDNTIEMFVRETDTPESLAGILAHEIGHAVDVTHFGDSERNRWRDARGISDRQWWPDAYASDFESGAGDFAEAFAVWAVDDPSSSKIAGPPTSEQLTLLRELLQGRI